MSAIEAGHCITCSDEGIPMQVSELGASGGEAVCVDECGKSHLIALDLLEDVTVGERVLAHAGVAIARAGGVPA